MPCKSRPKPPAIFLEMRVVGRLDNESAEHLTAAVNDAMRQGQHSVVVHLEGVVYISSAGTRRAGAGLQAVQGGARVLRRRAASPEVAETIRLTGLGESADV